MAFPIPAMPNFEEFKSETMKYLANLRSRIDKDSILGLWHKWKSVIGATCGTLLITWLFVRTCRSMNRRLKVRRLRFLIDEKRRQRESNIDQLQRKLAMSASIEVLIKRTDIVKLTFDELRNRLQQGTLTASEVLEAFQWRALEAQVQTNCVCEFLAEAHSWAAALDVRYSANSAESKPPLFGVPISFCEAYESSGHDSSLGLVSFLDHPCNEDSVLIKTLKRLGAVPFVITNVSQGLLDMGCSNPIYGFTTNPHDPMRSAGGSSGGEAALIAMRGSPLGLGVDTPGGGLRVPTHWCGICSLKPTSNRISSLGVKDITQNRSREIAVAGPMGPNVDSIVRFMRSVCNADSPMYYLDPYTAPIPFDDQIYTDTQPLTIGYYSSDGLLNPVAACIRAVDIAKRILETKGHRLVPISIPFDADEMRSLVSAYSAILFPDSGHSLAKLLENEMVNKSHEPLFKFLRLPLVGKRLFSKRTQSKRIASIYNAFSSTVADQEAIWMKINQYRQKFIRFCSERSLDCVLCPALATSPLPNGVSERMFIILWWYSALYNLLDFPVGVVRCTNVTSGDERSTSTEIEELENDWISKEIKKSVEGTVGLPVGVQCAALPFREEICLRMMKDIETGARI